jgi:hypothetical protein
LRLLLLPRCPYRLLKLAPPVRPGWGPVTALLGGHSLRPGQTRKRRVRADAYRV